MAEEHKQLLKNIESLIEDEQTGQLKAALDDMRESEIAEIVEILNDSDRRIIFDVLDKEQAAEILEKVNEATRSELFDLLEDAELKHIIAELDPEDAADVLAEMDEEDSQEVLAELEPAESAKIKELMEYEEDSAGGIMDPDVISVSEQATVAQAIEQIQKSDIDEDFFTVFVVDSIGKFLGDVRIRHLITSKPQRKISELIEDDTITVHVDTDQEEIRNIFSKNDLIVMPVLDSENNLVGRITADRIIEVAQEEAAEDIYTMAGTDADELEGTSFVRAARIRLTWLLPCLMGTAVTAVVVLLFKDVFNNSSILPIYTTAIAFMPMIAAISGNAGLQTSAIVVSGLAAGHLIDLKLTKVFAREAKIAFIVALSCGIIGGFVCAAVPNIINTPNITATGVAMVRIATAFTIAMFSSIMVATTLGLFLPFLFRRVGIDPAISSGPLVTTANDSISVAIYLTLTLVLA